MKENSGLPLHCESSHYSDSFRYLAEGYREGISRFGAYRKPWDQEIEHPHPEQFICIFEDPVVRQYFSQL